MVVEAHCGSRNDALNVLTHVGYLVTEIVAAIDRINWRGWRWVCQIGDVEVLREDSRCHDIMLVEAVTKVLASAHSSADPSPELQGLSDVIAVVDSDLATNCTLLNEKIKALEHQRVEPSHTSSNCPVLSMSTPINDAHGDFVTTLGDMLKKNDELKQENSLLKQRVDGLAADVTAQGGVVLGKHTFTLEL
jgi:hypothetical protein